MELNGKSITILKEGFSFVDATPKDITYYDQEYILRWKCIGCTVQNVVIRSRDKLHPQVNWMQIDERYGMQSDSVKLKIQYNEGAVRDANVIAYVTSLSTNETTQYAFNIKQARGRRLIIISDDKKSLKLNSNNDTFKVPVTYDAERIQTVQITSDADWLSATMDYAGVSNSTLNVVTLENTTLSDRVGHITITYVTPTEEGMIPAIDFKETIEVIQEPKVGMPSIKISVTEPVFIPSFGGQSVGIPYTLENGAYIKSATTDATFFTFIKVSNVNVYSVTAKETNFSGNIKTGKITLTIGSPTYPDFTYDIVIKQDTVSLSLTPSTLRFGYDGKVKEGSNNATTINGQGLTINNVEVTNGVSWVTTRWSGTNNTLFIDNVNENQNDENRSVELNLRITVQWDSTGTRDLYSDLLIVQEGAPKGVENPIWRDTFFSLDKATYGAYKYYKVTNVDNGEEIYRGQLFFVNDRLDINISDIAKDYININKYPFENTFNENNGYINLSISLSTSDGIFENFGLYHFYYNYDYDYKAIENNLKYPNLTNPIQDYVDKRQYFLWSVQDYYNSALNTADTTPVIIDYEFIGQTVQDSYTISNAQNTICTRVDNMEAIHIRTRGTESIEVRDTCAEYCLYYVNKKGGWSWLLMNGTYLKNNKITTKSYNTYLNNSLSSNFQNSQYLKQIKESWKLNTEYLNDEQTMKMEDLLMSPVVYLHNLNEDLLIAVTIDETSVDVKTFMNQKKKPYQYSFTVNNSQTKFRR